MTRVQEFDQAAKEKLAQAKMRLFGIHDEDSEELKKAFPDQLLDLVQLQVLGLKLLMQESEENGHTPDVHVLISNILALGPAIDAFHVKGARKIIMDICAQHPMEGEEDEKPARPKLRLLKPSEVN